MKSFLDTKTYWKKYETITETKVPKGTNRVR